MSENLRDHTLAWLDSIGADGLMLPSWELSDLDKVLKKEDIPMLFAICAEFVPAYRHADGSYHTFPEFCLKCLEGDALFAEECFTDEICATYKDHIKHKEAPK